MVYRNCVCILRTALLVLGLGFLVSPVAQAQSSTGSIRGTVNSADGGPIANADVVVRNPMNGTTRATTTNVRGFYSLPGLPPATYELSVRLIGHRPAARQLPLGIGQVLTIDFVLETSVIEIEELTVVAENVAEMRTSEIATNVTQEQINELPTSSRNFLDLVVLAPGTTISNDRIDGTARSFSAGAQSADQVNVFIDGASYKNDLLRGGVVGQDRSRGNPFPRNAVQEFRVLTQNYKAEYQKSSSAIITAVTKSGGNVWHGNAFFGYQNQGLVALDTFARANKANNPTTFREPDYKRWLVGLSGGGPIIRDKLHVFGSYEGNYQDRSNLVNVTPPTGFPALDSINFASRNGFFGSPFRSSLFFGKLTYAAGSNSTLELSANTRNEKDTREFGGDRPFESGVRFNNSVVNVGLKHSYFRGQWLNEAMVNYQRATDNPTPVPTNQAVNRFYGGAFCCAQIGPDLTIQDFTQKRLALRNDLTYSGLRWAGSHVIKGGVTLDFLNYRILKKNGVVPRFVYEEIGHDATLPDSFKYPDRVEFRAGNPNFLTDNTQFGVYAQDDWSVNQRLTVNAGIRWDYESHMLNYDYQTPQGIVDSLTKYSSLLAIPIDPKRYFTDGTQRPRFTGAIQPRLGFSYALDKDAKTTIFGGFGIFYDRTLFDQAIEERFAQQNPLYIIRFRQPGDTTPGRIDWNDGYLAGRPWTRSA
ncbi:MAG: TonB-dependent receptor [Gemmatimonadota bacterium]|nr:TonB-dependent receptor [Gemmatimonadota bacterium]